ncbi:Formyl-CoA:oxalate CoA-transferase [compost metagenome]
MEQAKERGLKVELPRSDGTKVAGIASPVRLGATPPQLRSAAPKLGEHTHPILAEWLDASSDDIAGWRTAGAFGDH